MKKTICNKKPFKDMKPGQVLSTSGFETHALNIYHVCEPNVKGMSRFNQKTDKDKVDQLKNCYKNSLKLCKQQKHKIIAIPGICFRMSVNSFLPKDKMVDIAVDTCREWCDENDLKNEIKIIFVLLEEKHVEIYKKKLESFACNKDTDHFNKG